MNKTALDEWICETEGLGTLTRENLEALQLRRLNALLRRERARGGFYAALPDRVSSLKELRTLPFTTPEELAAHGGTMLLTSQSEVGRVLTDATSGTTGAAKRVFYTAHDCAQTVGFFAAGLSELVFPGDTVMIAMPFSGPLGLGDLIASAIKNLGAHPLAAGTGKTFGQLARILFDERPEVFVGMPVPLLSMLRFCGCARLRRALVSGDACPPGVIGACERALGTQLFPHYGSREMGLGGAVTCPAHEGMHLRENHIIAEIIGPDSAPLPDGERGELCITTIGQEAQPLIRYRTGDMTRFFPDPCPCGGVTKRLDTVTRNPPAGLMSRLDDALFRLPGLIDYRAERTTGGGIILTALTDGSLPPEKLCAAAQTVCPASAVSASVRACQASDAPLCGGKREIPRAT